MLFKEEHKQMILNGTKTQTRRVWKKPMVKIGGIYKAKLMMLSKEYFAKIKVIKFFKQRLGNISEIDAKKEGYGSIDMFKEIWIKINCEWKPNLIVDVIEFELIGGKK